MWFWFVWFVGLYPASNLNCLPGASNIGLRHWCPRSPACCMHVIAWVVCWDCLNDLMVGHVCLFHDFHALWLIWLQISGWTKARSNYVRFGSLDLWTATLLVGVTVTEVMLFTWVAVCLTEHLPRWIGGNLPDRFWVSPFCVHWNDTTHFTVANQHIFPTSAFV